jgi:hypothetical protein
MQLSSVYSQHRILNGIHVCDSMSSFLLYTHATVGVRISLYMVPNHEYYSIKTHSLERSFKTALKLPQDIKLFHSHVLWRLKAHKAESFTTVTSFLDHCKTEDKRFIQAVGTLSYRLSPWTSNFEFFFNVCQLSIKVPIPTILHI